MSCKFFVTLSTTLVTLGCAKGEVQVGQTPPGGSARAPATGDAGAQTLLGLWKSPCNSMKNFVVNGVQSTLKASSYVELEIQNESIKATLNGYVDNDCADQAVKRVYEFNKVGFEEGKASTLIEVKWKVKLAKGSIAFFRDKEIETYNGICGGIQWPRGELVVIQSPCTVMFDSIRTAPDQNDELTLTMSRSANYSTVYLGRILADANLYYSKLMVKNGNTEEAEYLKKVYGDRPPRIYEFGSVQLSRASSGSVPSPSPTPTPTATPSTETAVGQVFILAKPEGRSNEASPRFEFGANRTVSEYVVTIDGGSAVRFSTTTRNFDVAVGSHVLKVKAKFQDGTESAEVEHRWERF